MSSDCKTYSVDLPRIKIALLAGVCVSVLGLGQAHAQAVPLHINSVLLPPLNDFRNVGGAHAGLTAGATGPSGRVGQGGEAWIENIQSVATAGDSSDAIIGSSSGGDGGAGGDGDTASVENSGELITHGDHSAGIVASSSGGHGGSSGVSGGGEGIDGARGGIASISNSGKHDIAGDSNPAIGAISTGGNGSNTGDAISGNGGAGGNSGNAKVDNEGKIITKGAGSAAIDASSIGGSGGDAYNDQNGVSGSGGQGGHGGDINVSNHGKLSTEGHLSAGILAVSTGGEGGHSRIALGAGGNAGQVDVTNHGDIETLESSSDGIRAESLGGRNGTGPRSDSGKVTVTNISAIATKGFGANAITARSLGENAGDVFVDQTGNLISKGDGSSGIFAQSYGVTNGKIDIAVRAGSQVIGGANGGAGVIILDGANNSLTNEGVISGYGDTVGYIPGVDGQLLAAGHIDGTAVLGQRGETGISNTGLVVGNIHMIDGANTFTNEQDGWMVAGSMIDLGGQEGSLFTNSGILSAGGVDSVHTTDIDGNFSQSDTGNMLVDLDIGDGVTHSGSADRLNVTGQASLGGRLLVNFTSAGDMLHGENNYVIVHADGGVEDDGMELVAESTAVADFSLVYTAHDAVLRATLDYAPSGLTENGNAVGNAVNAIQSDQLSPAFRPLASAIFAQPDIASLQRTYDLISGEGTAAAQQAYFSDTNAFIGAVSQQANLWSNPYALAGANADRNCILESNTCDKNRWRGWVSGFGSDTKLDGDAYDVGSGSLKSHSKGMAAGFDYELNQDLLLGFSFGLSKADFKVNDRLTKGDIEARRTAVYGAYRHNSFYVDGLFGFDWFDASTSRNAAILPTAGNAGFSDRLLNDFSGYGTNARLETGYRMDLGGVQFSPFAALQLSTFHMNSSTESADRTNGDLALYYKNRTINSIPLSLGAQLDAHIELGENAYFSPYVRAAWLHEFSNKRSVEAGFVVAPGYEFVVHGAAQKRNSAQIEAGFNLQIETGLSLYGKVSANLSGSNHDVTGSGGLRLRW